MNRFRASPGPLVLAMAITACFALFACGGSDDKESGGSIPAAEKVAPAKPVQRPGAEPTPAAPAAPSAPTPSAAPDPAAQIAAGAKSYATLCASCHGATGNADTPMAEALVPKPTRHDDAAYMATLSDDYLFKVIKEGGAAVGKSPMMAPWGGSLDDAQIRAVVAFIRTLPATAGN
jgi:mono/diheme cytochrome c family protein